MQRKSRLSAVEQAIVIATAAVGIAAGGPAAIAIAVAVLPMNSNFTRLQLRRQGVVRQAIGKRVKQALSAEIARTTGGNPKRLAATNCRITQLYA